MLVVDRLTPDASVLLDPALILVIAALTLACTALLFAMHLRRRTRPPPPPDVPSSAPPDLLDALRRQLIEPDRTEGPSLLPVLTFHLYPPRQRALYDRTRELDRRLLLLLLAQPSDPEVVAQVRALHARTRAARRALMQTLLPPAPPDPQALLRGLDAELDAVERALQGR